MIAFQSKKANRTVVKAKAAAVKKTDQNMKKDKSKEKKVTYQCHWCWRENRHRRDVCKFQPGGEWHDPAKHLPQKPKPAGWKDRPELQKTKAKANAVKDLNKEFDNDAKKEESETEEGTSDEESSVGKQVARRVKIKQKGKKVCKAKVYKAGIPPNAQSKTYFASNKEKRGKGWRQNVFNDSGSDLNLVGRDKAARDKVIVHEKEEKMEVEDVQGNEVKVSGIAEYYVAN